MHDPLTKDILPTDWVDLTVGDAAIVRRALAEAFVPSTFDLFAVNSQCSYQPMDGYPPLLDALERYRGAPCVVTTGAKQGLCALFYAAKRAGMQGVALRVPCWSEFHDAITLAGLHVVASDEPVPSCAYLLVSPNNPDGHVTSGAEGLQMYQRCKQLGVPFIHDAVYHNPIYVDGPLYELSDTSVFSAAKSYGLSGLRVGYVVTDDDATKQAVIDYVRATTAGTSVLSQRVLLQLIEYEERCPVAYKLFVTRTRELLADAKRVAALIDPDVLDATGVEQSVGIFGWLKKGPRFDANKILSGDVRVRVSDGFAYGDSTRVRLNLAVEPYVLHEAVRRLNQM